MSQTESIVAQCKCGHGWELQKHPDKMSDGPRCSECGAVGDKISIEEVTGAVDSKTKQNEGHLQDIGLVQAAKHERRSRELCVRVQRLVESLEGTTPSEADHQVASELQGIYWELKSLEEELSEESDPEMGAVSLDDLEAVSDRLNELESDIENHGCELETAEDLEDTIAELQSNRESIKKEIEHLKAEKTEVEEQIDKHTKLLDRVDNEETAWNMGYEKGRKDAKEEFAIHIPCTSCENVILMRPGSEMHRQASRYLCRNGWSCTTCV